MNELYEVLDLYLNHFVASRKCLEKVRVGAKYKKRYDKGKTPYQRVLAHPDVSDEVKVALQAEHETLNPLLLQREVARLSAAVFNKQREGERLR